MQIYSQRTGVSEEIELAEVKSVVRGDPIDMPYPTHVVLYHDQTEEVDGLRNKQREGWTAGKDEAPKTDRIGQA